ncbi:MAG: hypothetical protein PHS30_06015 [Bacteroidales bacterium]|nr:hypothetical protein [Bacteroidales bacterium]
MESYSKQNKFTKFMYALIFKPHTKSRSKKRTYKKLIQKPYSSFEGKIIRKINIETLDPFGFSIGDSIVAKQTFLLKTENKLHLKSKNITIRNLLLIHQNQKFDSLLAKESERLVRNREYIRDVSFFVKTTSQKADSVDIFIRVLDNWSLIPEVMASTSNNTVHLTEKNFLGLGHEFQNTYSKDFSNGMNAFSTNYHIPNIRNTYISTTLHYEIDGHKNFSKSLAIDRPFYSPFAKWAGGVSFASQFRKDALKDSNSVDVPLNLNFRTQDYWAGYALRIFKGNTVEARTTNLITTARYLRVRYLDNPSEIDDPLRHYTSENFYLTGIGLSTRKYVQDKYIFRFGITEDVPVGKVYGLTGGYQIKNNFKRLYLGARISSGHYYPWGYLSTNFEYATFFHASNAEQGIITADVNYFTGLFEIGKWKFRQFIKPQLTIGIDRFSYDSLTINDGFGIDGFNSTNLLGSSRLLLTLQTQAYAPWNFIGFRFGPFFSFSLGVLGDANTGFKNKKVYSQIGLGILIKNENLILNTFQFSLSFYPVIPGYGSNVLKANSFKTTDFGFRDFEIGKPAIKVFE